MARGIRPFLFGGLVVIGLAGLVTAGVMASRMFNADSPQAMAIGGPFQLATQADKSGDKLVTDQDFRGKWMLVYFGYTHCPDACPTSLSDIAGTLDKLGAKAAKVAPVFVTVDPERDTPAVTAEYAKAFGPSFVGLSGSAEQVAAAERAYHVYSAKHPTKDGDYSMDHSSIIYVMDPQGRFVTTFSTETTPDEMAKRLDGLIA